MKFNSFLKECQNREVFKKLSFYLVFSWLLIQVFAILWDPLGLPRKTVTFVLLMLLTGLPIYVFYIWKFQIEPAHQKELQETGAMPADNGFLGSKTPFQRFYFMGTALISILVISAVILIVRINFSAPALPETEVVNSDKIGVLEFGNNTGNPQYDILGRMAADWILHGITEKGLAQVVSPDMVSNYVEMLKVSMSSSSKEHVMQDYFKPSRIISGNYYINKGKLIFQCSITDGKLDETFIALEPVSCDPESPLDGIEALNQRILGYLITRENEVLNLQENPPVFEAYQYLLEAKKLSFSHSSYLELLEKAIRTDSNYFEPKVLRIAYYYNMGEFLKADSLLKHIPSRFEHNKRQVNLLKLYESLLKGNNLQVFERTRYEYNLAPFELNTNASMMVVALQYVNKPDAIDTIFRQVETKGMDLDYCDDCLNRLYIKALSELERKEYDSAIFFSEPYYNLEGRDYFIRPLIAAYIRSEKNITQLLERIRLMADPQIYQDALLIAGTENLLLQNQAKASTYFDQVLEMDTTKGSMHNLALATYYQQQFEKAIPYFEELIRQNPEKLDHYAYLAVCYHKTSKNELAREKLEELIASRADYQFGEVDYLLARFYASQDDSKAVLNFLLKAVAAGYLYTPGSFQYDPDLYAYLKKPAFSHVMNFWK